MKSYLVLNTEFSETRYFAIDNIPLLHAKLHMLNWKLSKSVLLQNMDNTYHPVARVNSLYIHPVSLIRDLDKYLSMYEVAKSKLPANFPQTFKLF